MIAVVACFRELLFTALFAVRLAFPIEGKISAARIPIIAMTAHAMDGDAERIMTSGIDRVLTKPLRKAKLVEEIAMAAGKEAISA